MHLIKCVNKAYKTIHLITYYSSRNTVYSDICYFNEKKFQMSLLKTSKFNLLYLITLIIFLWYVNTLIFLQNAKGDEKKSNI